MLHALGCSKASFHFCFHHLFGYSSLSFFSSCFSFPPCSQKGMFILDNIFQLFWTSAHFLLLLLLCILSVLIPKLIQPPKYYMYTCILMTYVKFSYHLVWLQLLEELSCNGWFLLFLFYVGLESKLRKMTGVPLISCVLFNGKAKSAQLSQTPCSFFFF